MGLAAFQAAQAALYLDASARAEFGRDPNAFARSHGLDAIEAARLIALGCGHAEAYARTLERKRRNEIARLASRTAAALGPAFAPAVRRYLAGRAPGPEPRAVRDARNFARFVAREAASAEARDAALADARALRG